MDACTIFSRTWGGGGAKPQHLKKWNIFLICPHRVYDVEQRFSNRRCVSVDFKGDVCSRWPKCDSSGCIAWRVRMCLTVELTSSIVTTWGVFLGPHESHHKNTQKKQMNTFTSLSFLSVKSKILF